MNWLFHTNSYTTSTATTSQSYCCIQEMFLHIFYAWLNQQCFTLSQGIILCTCTQHAFTAQYFNLIKANTKATQLLQMYIFIHYGKILQLLTFQVLNIQYMHFNYNRKNFCFKLHTSLQNSAKHTNFYILHILVYK